MKTICLSPYLIYSNNTVTVQILKSSLNELKKNAHLLFTQASVKNEGKNSKYIERAEIRRVWVDARMQQSFPNFIS